MVDGDEDVAMRVRTAVTGARTWVVAGVAVVAGLVLIAIEVVGPGAAVPPPPVPSPAPAASMHPAASTRPAPSTSTRPAAPSGSSRTPRARSVILLIGDGLGDSEVTIARAYAVGAAGRLAMDSLPETGSLLTWSVQRDDPARPDYVTDSAAAATALATGHKTYDGAVSVLPDGRAVPTLLELAKAAGLATGNVTTAQLTDATPAAQVAHVAERGCQGPVSMSGCPAQARENGGPGSIAEQLVTVRPDVALGGGAWSFAETVQAGPGAGRTVRELAADAGYRLVEDLEGLRATQTLPVLGLFADGDLGVEWTGPADAGAARPGRCRPNPSRPATQPRLDQMTAKALGLLERATRQRPRGFFLQVEGASIDKAAHGGDACGQIGETVGFDAAVAVALEHQRRHPGTLVIVTADHGQAAQLIEAGTTSAGDTTTLLTRDGVPLTVSFAAGPSGGSQPHTGVQVPIAAVGPGAAAVGGVHDQTEVFGWVAGALGLPRP